MTAGVVFIRGIMVRSGTNFLRDLLLVHPDCARSRAPVWEDFLVDEAEALIGYVDAVAGHWPARWGTSSEVRQEMLQSLGDGLLSFLRAGSPAPRVVAKTPSIIGLENFFALFPQAPLIVLVRDGRAVIESAMRSFGWSFERAAHAWRDSAERLLAFDRRWRATHGSRYRIVRYEDLVLDLRPTLAPLLDFCGLDPARFDYDAAEELPVRGSSSYGTVGSHDGPRPQWSQPAVRDRSFEPTQRWRQWDASQRARFAWLAADSMQALGYECEEAGVRSPRSFLRHRIRDARWLGDRTARAGWRRLNQVVRGIRSPASRD